MEVVDRAYAALDNKDADGFADCLSEDVTVQLINDPAFHGREVAREFFGARLSMVAEPEHTTVNRWEAADTDICEDTSHTKRLNGERVSVKGLAFWKVRDGRIFDLHVYEDLSPFADDFAGHQAGAPAEPSHWALSFFAALDARDVDGVMATLADGASYQLGSTEPVDGTAEVRARVEGLLERFTAVRHDLEALHDVGDDVVVLQFDATYATPAGAILRVPEAAVVRRTPGGLSEVRSFMDLTAAGS